MASSNVGDEIPSGIMSANVEGEDQMSEPEAAEGRRTYCIKNSHSILQTGMEQLVGDGGDVNRHQVTISGVMAD